VGQAHRPAKAAQGRAAGLTKMLKGEATFQLNLALSSSS
jgi:hypothetical protein